MYIDHTDLVQMVKSLADDFENMKIKITKDYGWFNEKNKLFDEVDAAVWAAIKPIKDTTERLLADVEKMKQNNAFYAARLDAQAKRIAELEVFRYKGQDD